MPIRTFGLMQIIETCDAIYIVHITLLHLNISLTHSIHLYAINCFSPSLISSNWLP